MLAVSDYTLVISSQVKSTLFVQQV